MIPEGKGKKREWRRVAAVRGCQRVIETKQTTRSRCSRGGDGSDKRGGDRSMVGDDLTEKKDTERRVLEEMYLIFWYFDERQDERKREG